MMLLVLVAFLAATPVQATGEAAVTAQLRVSPLAVALELSAGSVKIGGSITARVTTTNLGTTTLKSVAVRVRFQPVGLVAKGPVSTTLQQVKGGRSADASFKICAVLVGSYVVLAQATLDGVTVESPARLLVVVEGRPAKC